MNIQKVAEICHETNRAYCSVIGDQSQPSWKEAPDWQKQSAVNGVRFHLENEDAPPSASHDNWLAEKLKDGWKYGEVKDPDKKSIRAVFLTMPYPKSSKLKTPCLSGSLKHWSI